MVTGIVVDTPTANPSTLPAEPAPQPELPPPSGSLEPDDAARSASAPREELLVVVADKLLALSEDTKDIAASRLRAINAFHHLVPRLSGAFAAAASQRLIAIHNNPGRTELDRMQIEGNTPLNRTRIGIGAEDLPAVALVTSVEAFSRTGHDHDESDGDADLAGQIVAAALPMLRSDTKAVRYGALVIAAVADSSPARAHHAAALLFHHDAAVRVAGARYAPIDEHVFLQLTTDPAAQVRAALASRGDDLPTAVRAALAADSDAEVRLSLEHALTET